MKWWCRTSLIFCLALLQAGCGKSASEPRAEDFSTIQLVSQVQESVSSPRIASLLPASELFEKPPQVQKFATQEEAIEAPTFPPANQVWTLPDNTAATSNVSADAARRELLRELPPVDITPTSDLPENNPSTTEGSLESFRPIASLLPPVPLDLGLPKAKVSVDQEVESEQVASEEARVTEVVPERTEEELIALILRDCSPATTGVLTDDRINQIAKKKIRGAYAMANRGGYYAARQELIEVLRMISQAKDVQTGKPERAQALAEGLRALEEAEDFAPQGVQLEADLAIEVICASHRTPIAKQIELKDVLPNQMMNAYFRYAQIKLADAVSGEPAGSMALHALGKLSTQLGRVEPEKHRLSQRRAIAFQQAALLAHDQNHLAAHELATLLADAGHFAEAEKLLLQVASRDPNAVVLRNLSLVQEKLGHRQQSLANQNKAKQLARRGVSGTNNIQWVTPQAFSRTGNMSPVAPLAPVASTATAQPTARRQAPIRVPGTHGQQVPFAQPVRR